MKSIAIVALAAVSLVATAACSAPAASEEAEAASVDLTTSSSSSSSGTSVMRGQFEANGESFFVDVEITSKQNVHQRKVCDPYVSPDDTAWAGSSASPSYQEDGGSICVLVRAAATGKIIGEASDRFPAFSVYNSLDIPTHCTKAGKIANREPSLHFENVNPFIWVPGVVAETSKGPIWINPSYGGVGREYIAGANGTAEYRQISPISEATTRPRPFGGGGQELVFEKGELVFTMGASISLEVGTDIQGAPFGHAKHVETVQLTRR